MHDNVSVSKRKSQFRPTNEFTLRDLIRVVLFRKWLIIAMLILPIGAAFYYIKVTPATYKANATIIKETNYGKLPSEFMPDSYDYGIDQSQILVLKNQPSLAEIKHEIHQNHGFDVSLNQLRESLSLISNKSDRNVVFLYAIAPSAEQSQIMANVAADVFISKVAEMKSSELTQGVDFLKDQLDQVESKMHETEEALNKFRDKEGLVPQESSGSDSSGLLGKLGDLQTQSIEIENEVELTKSQLKTLEGLISDKKKYAQSQSAVGTSLEVDQLRERLIGLQLDLNSKLETLTEKDPEIIALRKKIESAQSQLKSEFNKMLDNSGTASIDPIAELQSLTQQFVTATVQLKGLESKGALINERLKKFKDEHPEIASKQVELIRLQRQSRIYEQAFTNLSAKFQDVRLLQQMKGSGLKIVDRAYLPNTPIAPKKKLILIGAGVFGLFLGLMITLLLDYMSDTIRTKEDIERSIELPVLGMISQIGPFSVPENTVKRRSNTALVPEGSSIDNIHERKAKQKPSKEILGLLSHSLIYAPNGNTKTPAMENYWNLAMSIKYANMDNPIKSILVTSSVPGERKTTTASNLAIVNARLGMKVLLIDADLNRPMIHRIFQQNRRPGLSDLITIDEASNDSTFDYVAHGSIRNTVVENLYLLPCGSSAPNTEALLSSSRLENLISAFKEKFDLIIIDSAPILIVSSVVALSKEADGVLFVMRSGKTRRKMALNGKEVLDSVDAKIIGTVLTGVNYNIQYGYYYRRYYGYYYHQKDDD